TMYPVASQNTQDLYHLMDVYLDAVFHPNILKDPRILMQEGWHYELTDEDAPVNIKGVVYNEMKGAFSSADSVLGRKLNHSLYPDTPYGCESGGAPEAIPDLTQEKFMAFYRKYYHASNSFIYLYGDMDMAEYLTWIDEHYLAEFDVQEGYETEKLLPVQPAFEAMHELEVPYSVSADQGEEEGYFAYAVSIWPEDSVDCFGLDILKYMLLDAQGAPLKKALTDADLGKNIYGDANTRAYQGDFSITAKGVDLKRKDEFVQLIDKTLREIAEKGFTQRQKLAALNRFEFQLREGEYGGAPAGLIIGIQYIMNSWLYGADPFQYTRFDDIFAAIREKADQGFFENLIKKYLLDNPHAALVVMKPEVDLAAKEDRQLAQRLAEFKASLTDEEKKNMIETTQALLAYQAEDDPEEVKKMVPHLSVSDMKKEAEQVETECFELNGVPCWFTEAECSQILYMKAYWDLSGLSIEQLPYAAVLASVLGQMNTENYTYEELNSEINIRTGGIGWSTSVLENLNGTYRPEMTVVSKCLSGEAAAMPELILEILQKTKFNDPKRLKEILNEEYAQLEEDVAGEGHVIAMQRAFSHLSEGALAGQYLSGLDYIQFMKGLVRNFDTQKDEIIAKLEEVRDAIVCQKGMNMAGGCTAENKAKLLECMDSLRSSLSEEGENTQAPAEFTLTKCNEGLITPGQVQYVVKAGLFDVPYHGSMMVARQILGLDFLWNRLRVQGGAYGAFAGFAQKGQLYFASYRDPNLASTLAAYDMVPEYLANFQASDEAMEKFIIGTVGGLDTPLTPALRINIGINRARSGQTAEMIQRMRDEVLNCTAQDLQNLSEVVRQGLENGCMCTVGSKEMLTKEKDLFDQVFEVL
ncbi:MAG: insulinase family protein, partial [Firmicutes bacterium]|nr:insulinase family protein [Bacillota bacterium]